MQNKKTINVVFKTGIYAAFFALGLLLLAMGLFFYYTWDLPRPENFTELPFIQSTKIYDRTGKVLLYDIYGEERREIVPFDKISDSIKHAVLSSEDARFYHHGGIDIKGLARAILVNLKLKNGGMSSNPGGSTITQQLIRSVYLSRQKTLARKIREMVLSIEIERRYSKDQIFDWYLNKIPFGQNAYGIQAASQTYFNKQASQVTVPEAAVLAALLPAPSYYSPYGPNKDLLLQRKDYILGRMKELGYINSTELESYKKEIIQFSQEPVSIKAPHFVMYVKKYLEEKYGEDFLKEKGLRVYTSLDWELQKYAEDVVKEADSANRQFGAHNASVVALDPKTGEILALIGSKDYFQKSYPAGCDEQGNSHCLFNPKYDVATIGKRQPGSSFKPFVYATAFAKGYLPETVLWDAKTEFNPNCPPDASGQIDQYGLKCYHPQNYDGKHRGPVSLRSSLAGSLNVPSVALLYLAGVGDSIKTARDFGITTLTDEKRYGLSLVLGGGEVNLLELASAYGVFATEGMHIPPVSILRIEDSFGAVIEQNTKETTKVLDTNVARQINDILSDNNARAPIFGAVNALHFDNYDVAAKTGTTENFNDAWTMGYSSSVVVGVWVGNNNNAPINKKTGIGLAAPIWRKIMEKIISNNPPEDFIKPNAPENTNPILLGQFPDNPPRSILYYINRKNPLGPPPQNPAQDPMFVPWEAAIQAWLGAPGGTNPVETYQFDTSG